jgi:hypothetical protein
MKSLQRFIRIAAVFVLVNSGVYFVTAYSQMQESSDAGSLLQTMLFTTAAVSYLPLGIWMIKNKLHSRAPYVISSLISVALIGLYVLSRTVSLPIVGIQDDVGVVDILCKLSQGGIVVISLLLLRNWHKKTVVAR